MLHSTLPKLQPSTVNHIFRNSVKLIEMEQKQRVIHNKKRIIHQLLTFFIQIVKQNN